mmetsp:Transcript_147/g.164  ORF Transcript_147/g.164 Transcript_147/m.164 type:complete len:314 (-) Transcript_147:304-1245(-)
MSDSKVQFLTVALPLKNSPANRFIINNDNNNILARPAPVALISATALSWIAADPLGAAMKAGLLYTLTSTRRQWHWFYDWLYPTAEKADTWVNYRGALDSVFYAMPDCYTNPEILTHHSYFNKSQNLKYSTWNDQFKHRMKPFFHIPLCMHHSPTLARWHVSRWFRLKKNRERVISSMYVEQLPHSGLGDRNFYQPPLSGERPGPKTLTIGEKRDKTDISIWSEHTRAMKQTRSKFHTYLHQVSYTTMVEQFCQLIDQTTAMYHIWSLRWSSMLFQKEDARLKARKLRQIKAKELIETPSIRNIATCLVLDLD